MAEMPRKRKRWLKAFSTSEKMWTDEWSKEVGEKAGSLKNRSRSVQVLYR